MSRFAVGLLVCGIALVLLVLSLSVRSEPLRACLVVGAGSMLWVGFARLGQYSHSRFTLTGMVLAFSMVALSCVWSGLNVIRFYLHNPAHNPSQKWEVFFDRLYGAVCSTQIVIQWCVAVLGIAFVVFMVILFLRWSWIAVRKVFWGSSETTGHGGG